MKHGLVGKIEGNHGFSHFLIMGSSNFSLKAIERTGDFTTPATLSRYKPPG